MDITINTNTVVVFDLDDTLYNELDYLKSAYQQIAKHLDSKRWKSLYALMFSLYRNENNVFEMLSNKFNVDKKILLELYRNHTPNIFLFDGVINQISSIKSKSGKIGIITDGRSNSQMTKIKALGLIDVVDKVVISEEIGTEKPDLNNFKIIENAFPNSEYWYIADNLKKDFLAPNKLGWKTIGLIDNGMNIHYESYKYFNKVHEPQSFILSIKDLNIT